jgi:hypothetical protein
VPFSLADAGLGTIILYVLAIISSEKRGEVNPPKVCSIKRCGQH